MKTIPEDIEEELGVNTPSPEQLNPIRKEVNRALLLMGQIEDAEEFLANVKSELHILNTKTLPDLLSAAGMDSFSTNKGVYVEIRRYVSGSLPKDEERRAKAFSWVKEIGAEDVIKGKIDVVFERGDKTRMDRIERYLKRYLKGLEYDRKVDIHPETLKKLARERSERGEEVPWETLGLTTGRTAKIELPPGMKKAKKEGSK